MPNQMLSPSHLAQLEHPWDVQSVTWSIDSRATVVEVGAYKGRWASIMCDLYGCRLYAFEPQLWALSEARKRMADCSGVEFYNYALGDRDGKFEMGNYETDGCSFVKVGARRSGLGQMREIKRAFVLLGIEYIDVMLINIEGYEYTLLPHMARLGMLEMIDNLMVQFHLFAVNEARHNEVLEMIGKTHRVLWDYGSVLTAWRRKDV